VRRQDVNHYSTSISHSPAASSRYTAQQLADLLVVLHRRVDLAVLAKCGPDGITDNYDMGSVADDGVHLKPNCTCTTADMEAARNEVRQGTS
jgi:hypothetical protein